MTDVLKVENRTALGTASSRRLRRGGQIPAVLYGHGEAVVNLAIPAEQLSGAIRHGAKLVELAGAVSQNALIRDVQWDAFGIDVLHVDLTRVSMTEMVEVSVSIELRGDAPGVKEGGVIEHTLHEVEIECPAGKIPDKFEVSVNQLRLNENITVATLQLPEGARLITDISEIIVNCHEAAVEPEEEEVVGEGLEPELIGRKEEEEGEEGEKDR